MTDSTRAPERRRPAALAALLALAAAPSVAELVVLTDGAVLKVETFRAAGDLALLELPGGGRLEMDLARVERVVDDEVEPPPPGGGAPLADAATGFEVRWREGQTAPEVPFRDEIEAAARRHGINPLLVAAVARVESAFDARAISWKGARGLMQLMPATARRFGLRGHELFDPARNIEAGTRYLAWLASRFEDDLPRILAGYNAGEGAVERHGGVPPYRETREYVRRIYARLGLAVSEAAGGR